MALRFTTSHRDLSLDEALIRAGSPASVSDGELRQFIYHNFPEILDTLKTRTDFPVDEGSADNLLSCLCHFCYRTSTFDIGFKPLTILAYEEWYKAMLISEKHQDTRSIHKGMPLHQLGILYLEFRDRILAKKYFLLAHIEDIQEFLTGNRETHKSQAYRMLRSEFRVPDEELESLKDIVGSGGDKYPERPLMAYLVDKDIYKNRASENSGLAINEEYAQFLLEKATTLKKASVKGKYFTRLVNYLFTTVGGFEVLGEDLITKTGENDYDLLIRNMISNDNVFEELGRYLISECKFIESRKAGINELTKLLYKIKYHDCKCGILFSRSGVSFGRDYNLTIKKAFNRDSIAILTINQSELEQVIKGRKTFLSVILSAYERVKFEVEI